MTSKVDVLDLDRPLLGRVLVTDEHQRKGA